ncbi:MAG: UMP kinase [Patescibacteria group bacterium]|nr:UMP kinase [Patescibacteria group bacterium]
MNKTEDVILSIAGSIIFRDIGINTLYLKDLNSLLRKQIASLNRRFFLFIGGGHTSREYQYTAERVVGKVKNEDMHWLGVHATRLNAHLLRTVFRDIAYPKVVIRYDRKPNVGEAKVVVCAGWLPGTSTDFDMINLAKLLRIKKTYSLLNVAGIYDRDPKLFKKAKPINHMSWPDYREMIGDWWDSKREIPFDPFASKLAEHFRIKVVFLEGKNLRNLENALAGKGFAGSVIE